MYIVDMHRIIYHIYTIMITDSYIHIYTYTYIYIIIVMLWCARRRLLPEDPAVGSGDDKNDKQ